MSAKANGRQAQFQEIFARCGERAAGYDRENRFFTEDFEELKAAGYLLMPIPQELGGLGMTMAEVMEQQRQLAYHAAPTAIALNMHLYFMGAMADLWRRGDRSVEWALREGAAGKVFAAGHAESGNDFPVVWSSTGAVPVEGGYRFRGHKHFGSLTPVWDYLGAHGLDTSDPDNPHVVHAFISRASEGVRIVDTWDDVLGMRATRSDDTMLEDVFVPAARIAAVAPAGFGSMPPLVGTMFLWFQIGVANVYLGLARRLFDMSVAVIQKKKSMAMPRGRMANHPAYQNAVADMFIDLEGLTPQVDLIARHWSEGVDHGPAWPLKFVATKVRITERCWAIADQALELAGGFGIFPASGFERLVRDARLGRIHPANGFLAREMIGKALLGINIDEQPRWG